MGGEQCRIAAERLDVLLAGVGLSPHHLSQSGQSSLNFLATLSNMLHLKDTETSRYHHPPRGRSDWVVCVTPSRVGVG